MFERRRPYSYAEQKHHRHRLIRLVLFFLAIFTLYNCLTAFFFSTWVLDNNSMRPDFTPGDRLLFTSFVLPAVATELTSRSPSIPYKRGNIVLINSERQKQRKWPLQILDLSVRFFTAQRISIFANNGQHYIKRVIGLPGDEISMSNFVFRVKAAGSSYSLTEFELAEKPYFPDIPQIPALWDETIPFSSSMDTVILGPDEFFLVSDDRSNTNDSRTWGPVSRDLIAGRAVLRFWPLNKISRP
jgi:signal peptidase I